MYNLFVPKVGDKINVFLNILAWVYVLFFLYSLPLTLVNVIDNYFSTSFKESIRMMGEKNVGVGATILVIYSILFYGIFIYGLFYKKSNVNTVLKKYFFKTWFFNYWKNNKTISGKTYLKRIIILFVLIDIIFPESDAYIQFSETSFSWSRSGFGILFGKVVLLPAMLIIPQLWQDVRRINAVFLNNISLRRITFNLILFFYVIIYYDYFLIKLLPNDYPNLSEIGLLILIAIQFYLIVKNSPITDSKQHEG